MLFGINEIYIPETSFINLYYVQCVTSVYFFSYSDLMYFIKNKASPTTFVEEHTNVF